MEDEETLIQDPITPAAFAAKIKTKYPQYKDVDDLVLAQKIIEKYPQYKSQVDFNLKKKEESLASDTEGTPMDGQSDLETVGLDTLTPKAEPKKNEAKYPKIDTGTDDRFRELINKAPLGVGGTDSNAFKEWEAIRDEFQQRPFSETDNSDLLKRLEDLQPVPQKSGIELQVETVKELRHKIDQKKLKADTLSRITGKTPEEILDGDQDFKQLQISESNIKGRDAIAIFGSNLTNASAGIAGTPNAIIESVGKLFMSDEQYDKIPDELKDDFFTDLLKSASALPTMKMFANIAESGKDRQRELMDDSENLRVLSTQYDNSITEDIFSSEGDLKQGAKRLAVEGFGSIPSLVQAILPYVGITSIVAGSAANKLEENKKDGNLQNKDVADAWINGAAEGVLEAVTKGLAKKMVRSFGAGTKEQARGLAKNLVDNLIYTPLKEGGSEAATSIIQNLSEALVLGKEVDVKEAMYEVFDSFLIGGVVGGGMGSVTALGEGINTNRKAIDGDKQAQEQLKQNPQFEGQLIELNIPAEGQEGPVTMTWDMQEGQNKAEGNTQVEPVAHKEDLQPSETPTETTPKQDPPIDGSIPVGDNTDQQPDVQPPVEPGASKEEVKTYRLSDSEKSPEYKVTFREGVLNITDSKGKEPSRNTKRKVMEKYADDFDFDQGAITEFPEGFSGNTSEFIAENSSNPREIATELSAVSTAEFLENQIDYKARIIADNIGNAIDRNSYINFGDANNIGFNMAKSYFAKKGKGWPIDSYAQELSELSGFEITPQDVVDHMEAYPGGRNDVYKEARDTYVTPLRDAFTRTTGLPATDKFIQKAIEHQRSADVDYKLTDVYTDQELLTLLDEREQSAESAATETAQIDPINEGRVEGEGGRQDEGRPGIQEESGSGGQEAEPAPVKPSKTKEGKIVEDKNGDSQITFDFLGTPLEGTLKPNGDIVHSDGTKYNSKSSTITNIKKSGSVQESGKQTTSKPESTDQATQARKTNLTKERIKPSKQKPVSTPKKLNQIVADVAKNLKATVVYGKSRRRNSIGTYSPSNTLVKIRNAGDLDTVAHELGHLIDDRYDVVGSAQGASQEIAILRQLKWFSDRGGSNPPAKATKEQKRAYLQREGMAEFMRAYIANPKEAKVVAPELFEQFERMVDPKDIAFLKEFSMDYLNFANATAIDKINSQVEDANIKDKKGFMDWIQGFVGKDGELQISYFDKFKANWTNSMHIPNKMFRFANGLDGKGELKPEENFELMSRVLAGINGKVENILGKGLIGPRAERNKDGSVKRTKDSKGNVMNVSYLLGALDNSSEKVLKQEMNETIAFLVAQRTIEYVRKLQRTGNLTGIGGGIDSDIEVATEYLNEVEDLKNTNEAKYERIVESARRYREFADAGLRYMVDSGRMTEESYRQIKDGNEYYVSLARVNEMKPGDELIPFLRDANKIGAVKEIIKKVKGGTSTIQNPYISLLQNTVNIIKESDRNKVMNSFVQALSKPRTMGDGTPINFAQVARPAQAGDKNTIKIYVDGNLEYWQFEQNVYDALKGLEGIASNKLLNAFGKPADLIRFTVTTFPVFALRNASRDTISRLIISRSSGTLADLNFSKEEVDFWELYGGSQAGFYLTNKDSYRDVMSSSVKKLTEKGGIILDPRKLSFKGYRKVLQRGENINRVAEYKSSYRKAKKQGMDDYNAGLYAAYQSRDLMDFAVAGHYMRAINRLVPFSNAAVQSVKRSVKGAKENPRGFTLRMALYTILPQIAFRAIVSANGDDEEYEQLPDWQRDLFWNFKTPWTGNLWISIPKPFELGIPSSLVDRGISKAKGNEDAFEGSVGSTLKALVPFDEAAMVGSLRPIIEVSSNHDFFRDKDIIPYWERNKTLELREGTQYASRLGKSLSGAFGLVGTETDPRYIDHVVKGYGTYYGDWLLSISDIGKENSRNQFNFTKTGFARDMPVSQAKSVKKAIGLAEDMGVNNQKSIKILKGMVKSYYDLDDPKAKKKLAQEIWHYAEAIIPKLEAQKQKKLKEVRGGED